MDVSFDLSERPHYKPISGYGVIGNTRTAALVGYDGSIDWCCFPRFDSPSVFAALLDWKKGGRWAIQPARRARAQQEYVADTNVLRTVFQTEEGSASLIDFMPCTKPGGNYSVLPEIHRVLSCEDGRVEMRFVFNPAFDYGRERPKLVQDAQGVGMKKGKFEMVLSWTRPLTVRANSVNSRFLIERGEKMTFVLSYGEVVPRRTSDYHTSSLLARTQAYWRKWVSGLDCQGKWRDIVVRSALTLKLLTYSPTGAIVAAVTTSLPEALGGKRNWDYRFSWIRDSASSLRAFNMFGSHSEAESYLQWLIVNNPALEVDLHLMYDVNGGTELPERELDYLEGYRGSKPVRVGNAAARQFQFDVYGYMLDAVYISTHRGRSVSGDTYFRFVKPLADHIAETWARPSDSIWELRERRRHYVYTKAWAYIGLDRAIRIARSTHHLADVPRWASAKRKIKAEVLTKGWSEQKKSFVMYYGSSKLDSANLLLPLIGFVRATDKRMVGTIEAIHRELADGPFVYRTTSHRQGARREGAFLLCSFWLVSCLAEIGETSKAEEYFGQLVGCSNHLGLYSEEFDPVTREALGNFPQAFSHLGLMIAANSLDRSRPGT